MSGIVHIAPDKSAQLNSKQDQTLWSRRCFTPISDEKKKGLSPSPTALLVSVERASSPCCVSSGCLLSEGEGLAQFSDLSIVQCQPQMGWWGECFGPPPPTPFLLHLPALSFSGMRMLSSFKWSPGCCLRVFWTLAAELCSDRKKHNYSLRLEGNCEHLPSAFLFNTCLECLS